MKATYRFILSISSILILFLSILPACKKFVTIDAPVNQIGPAAIFSNDQAALSAVHGLYSRMGQSLSLNNGAEVLYTGLSADELYNTVSSPTYDPFTNNALLADNSTIYGNFWSPAYVYIYHTNAVLEGLEKTTSLTDSVKRQLKGEMLVVRSLTYFYLLNLFNQVPFETNTDYRVNSVLPRTGSDSIYQNLIRDVTEAQMLLKNAYPSSGKARPNKWTATALLARIYLYGKEFSNAETQATAVINSGMYGLASSLNSVFTASSAETIWQLLRDNNNTAIGTVFIPSNATTRPNFAITPSLLNSFEGGDGRKTAWLGSTTVSGQTYYYPNKYKVRAATPVTEYYNLFRLAEQYLIRAEARAGQNKLSEAVADLNLVRSRAGLSSLSTLLTQERFQTAIEQERRIELFSEGGHRWLDIKRRDRADALLSSKPNWQATDTIYPIPLSELQKNPFLIQNPGY